MWWATLRRVLLVVATQILQMLRQLLPLVRFDGYHVLADLTGVPDLFQRIGPVLTGLVPWKQTDPRARALKGWARAVVTAWVLVVVPTLLADLVLLVLTLPRLVGTALAAADAQRAAMLAAAGDGDLVGVAARGASMVIVLLPVLAFGYMFARLVRQVAGAVWRRTAAAGPARAGRPGRPGPVAGLVAAWWPPRTGTVRCSATRAAPSASVTLARPVTGSASASRQRHHLARTRRHRRVATPAGHRAGADGGTVVQPTTQPSLRPTGLRPRRRRTRPARPARPRRPRRPRPPTRGTLLRTDQAAGPWIFPFDEPLAPGQGDNQALAVNTTDGTVVLGGVRAGVGRRPEPAGNTNEAFAAASCNSCAAVAVAFQIVLVVGDMDVAVPQNLAVAVNYECTSCLTYSLAVQLFLTVPATLSEEAIAWINELWQRSRRTVRGSPRYPWTRSRTS